MYMSIHRTKNVEIGKIEKTERDDGSIYYTVEITIVSGSNDEKLQLTLFANSYDAIKRLGEY